MKSLLFVFSLFVVAVFVRCDPADDLLEKSIQECRIELRVPDEKLKISAKDDDPQINCWNACIMIKIGAMINDKVVPEKMIEHHMKFPNFNGSKKAAIIECVNTANQQSDKCDAAGAFFKCKDEKFGPPKQ